MSIVFHRPVFYIYSTAHSENKRLRKPSKRLLEWTEEYDQIFSVKKKTKKTQGPLGMVGVLQSGGVFMVISHAISSSGIAERSNVFLV